ncbi:MAG: protease inhibitor I42 family protein [Candidatus Limnocylindrales bacterium]
MLGSVHRWRAGLLAIALVIAGCTGAGGGTTINLTSADDGSAIRAALGERIVISLDANPTTGYTWQVAPGLDASVVEFVSEAYQQDPAGYGAVGVGGTDVLTFHAVGEGTTTIVLVYQRSGDATAAESFTVTVTVAQ